MRKLALAAAHLPLALIACRHSDEEDETEPTPIPNQLQQEKIALASSSRPVPSGRTATTAHSGGSSSEGGPRREDNSTIRKPVRTKLLEVIVGQPPLGASVRIYDVDLAVSQWIALSIASAGECDQATVGRPSGTFVVGLGASTRGISRYLLDPRTVGVHDEDLEVTIPPAREARFRVGYLARR
jgi:hypothetical protein